MQKERCKQGLNKTKSESKFAEEESGVWGFFVGFWVWEVSVGSAKGCSPLLFKGVSGF